jgi:hypothetical protein
MKRHILYMILPFVVAVSSCDDDDKQTDTQHALSILLSGKPWTVESVDVDGTDKTSVYEDLQITFTENTFTTTGGGSVWPASGTWQFSDETAKIIKRGDDVLVTIDELADKKVALSLTSEETTLGEGRGKGVAGDHTFTFIRQ